MQRCEPCLFPAPVLLSWVHAQRPLRPLQALTHHCSSPQAPICLASVCVGPFPRGLPPGGVGQEALAPAMLPAHWGSRTLASHVTPFCFAELS